MDIKGAAKKGFQKISAVAANVTSGMQSGTNDTCITVMCGDKMRIDHDKLRDVLIRPEIGDLPVAIISIAGSTRTGKSFLMNFMARYLKKIQRSNPDWMAADSSTYFRWKCGTKRETTGIRVSNDVFKIKRKDGREVAVLLMDSQGLFDEETSKDVNTTLLTLSTLMSSVQIFNTKSTVNTQDLEYLKICVDFAMATAQAKEPYFKLQDLVFLVRDSPEEADSDDDDDDGEKKEMGEDGEEAAALKCKENTVCPGNDPEDYGFKRGEKYLVQIINSEAGGDEQKAMRKRIKTSFRNVKCFMMPFPGENVMKKKFTGKNEELNDDFKKYVKIFVEEIAHPDKLPDKMAKAGKDGRPAREILNMVAACDNTFAMKLYEAKSLMEANVKAHYASEYEEAIFQYDGIMKGYNEGSNLVDMKKLREHHNYAKNLSVRRFTKARQLGDGKEQKFYAKHLEEKCEEHFKTTVERWEAKQSEIKARKALKTVSAFGEYESQMQKRQSTEPVSEEQLKDLHERSQEHVIQKYGKKIDTPVLRAKAQAHFKELQDTNSARKLAEKELGKERRQRDLFALFVRLQDETAKIWAEKLKSWMPDEQLNAFDVEVREKITVEYFAHALLPAEEKYRCILNEILEKVYEKAKESTRGGQLADRGDRPSLEMMKRQIVARTHISQTPDVEKVYQLMVAEVALVYAEELQQDLNNRTSIEDLKARKMTKMSACRNMYYRKCFYSIEKYSDDVKCMLNNKLQDAKKRNDENWTNIQARIEALVRTSVLEIERELQEAMNDRYLKKKELRSHYDKLKKELTENLATKFVLGRKSLKISNEFKVVAGKQLDESHDKMAETNEKNKGRRNVKTGDLQKSSSWFKRMWKAIKEFFADL